MYDNLYWWSLGWSPTQSNIVTLLDVLWDQPGIEQYQLGPTFYLECVELGNLGDFSKHDPDGLAQHGRKICLDISQGLHALHSCGVVHGDVKFGNVLIFETGDGYMQAKLTDFGCSVVIRPGQEKEVTRLKGSSPPWDTPEAEAKIRGDLLHSTDIYSFGLLYWRVLLKGINPFGDEQKLFCFSEADDHKVINYTIHRLKKEEDLSPYMIKSIFGSTNSNKSDSQRYLKEVKLVSESTLSHDPKRRSLTSVIECL